MNTCRVSSTLSRLPHTFRLLLGAALFAGVASVHAEGSATADRADYLLARDGAIAVQAAGPYVQIGSYRMWVEAKLGRPSEKLADGTWLYRGREVKNSDARGTLVVRFDQGQVSALSLVTAEVAHVLVAADKVSGSGLVASRRGTIRQDR
jgi:hypothetical protein